VGRLCRVMTAAVPTSLPLPVAVGEPAERR
jgi:hypothetical protein